MAEKDFLTNATSTWCPGCPNFAILKAVSQALNELVEEKMIKRENIVMVTGIGCHGKMFDYLNVNGFYGLHGRAIPVAVGLKLANKNLKVLVFTGDGDLCAEGLGHFIHFARYNPDITVFLHQNQVFALTTGQITPTSEKGFKGPSNLFPKEEEILNPVLMALNSGASFVARTFALDLKELKDIAKKAILHAGFSFVEVLQPCLSYHNGKTIHHITTHKYYIQKPEDLKEAMERANEWDYSLSEKKIPLGVFFEANKKTLEERFSHFQAPWYQKKKKISLEFFDEFR